MMSPWVNGRSGTRSSGAKTDPITRRRVTTPGVGPPTAVRFVAALDQINRFTGAHANGDEKTEEVNRLACVANGLA